MRARAPLGAKFAMQIQLLKTSYLGDKIQLNLKNPFAIAAENFGEDYIYQHFKLINPFTSTCAHLNDLVCLAPRLCARFGREFIKLKKVYYS